MSSTQTSTRSGACLCNSINFELTGAPFASVLCHCNNCKRSAGAPFGTFLIFNKNQVKIVDEQKHLRSYAGAKTGSGQKSHRQFCGNCGASLFVVSDRAGGDILLVASGCVDDTTGWDPKQESFSAHRVEWLPEFSGMRSS